MTDPTLEEIRASTNEAFGKLLDAFALPEGQDKAIAAWERIWHFHVPDFREKLVELHEALDTTEEWGEAEIEAIKEAFKHSAKVMEMASADNAPNPDLIAVYYLRRVDARLERIEDELGIRRTGA